jgi:hypothetical protein
VTASLDQASIQNTIDQLRAIRPELAEKVAVAASADLATAMAPDDSPAPTHMSLPVVAGRTLAIFVLGCGRGGMVHAIASALETSEAPTVVVVVEVDPARLLASLVADDWTTALDDARIRFALGPDLRRSISDAVPEASFCLLERGLKPGVGLVPGDVPDHAGRIRGLLDAQARAMLEDFRSACMAQAARHPTTASSPSLPRGRWRILSSVSSNTTAIRHLAPAILNAAGRAGHQPHVHLADTLSDPFLTSRTTIASLDADADLVVDFLRPGRHLIPWRTDFPSLVLVSSNPRLLPIDTYDWSNRDLVVVTGAAFAAPYEALGLRPEVRSLATEIPPIEDLIGIETPACDVIAIGNIPAAHDVVEGLPDESRRLIESIATEWIATPDRTIDEMMASFKSTGDEAFMAKIRLALGYEATRRRRIASVVALAEAGFSVRVHGEEAWLAALAGTAAEGCWHGWMTAGKAQAAAFRNAGVALNVNSFAAPNMLNMRSFDVPAAGGVLVTDDRPAVHDAFDVGREALVFQRIDELPDLVGDVLRDRERRNAIAHAARARVERDHSWDAWWAWAEKKLRARFPSRK